MDAQRRPFLVESPIYIEMVVVILELLDKGADDDLQLIDIGPIYGVREVSEGVAGVFTIIRGFTRLKV